MELKNLMFAFGDHAIIKQVNYKFKSNAIYVIKGMNGSGKTTLVRLLLGLLKPDSGTIENQDVLCKSYLPDSNGLYHSLSVLDNIKFRLGIYHLSYAKMKKEVNALLQTYKLEQYIHMPVSQLSLGSQKKAGLICSCLVNPDLLILDEPSVGLDQESKRELAQLITAMKKEERIIIVVSHDEDFLSLLPSYNLLLQDGLLYDE